MHIDAFVIRLSLHELNKILSAFLLFPLQSKFFNFKKYLFFAHLYI